MKVLLRHINTALYYASPEHWVVLITQARDFGTSDGAIQHSHDQGLSEVEMVLRYEQPLSEIILVLPKARGRHTS
jgi:hypothetical protein